MANKQAPEKLTLADALCPMPAFNVALVIDRPDPDIPSKEPCYNSSTDDGLASLRSKHVMRTREEIDADRTGDLPLGYGLSLREPMAGQCENNQFPVQTNQYGKQRA